VLFVGVVVIAETWFYSA